jgi:hypothetical protein
MIDSEKETLIADVGAVAVPDAERERASTELRAHFTAGHLDVGEFSVRLDEVWVAVTTRDIQDALRDLPAEGWSRGDCTVPPRSSSPTPHASVRSPDALL